MSTNQPIAAPTAEDIIAAFAQSLLPLAGPQGLLVADLVPAVQQFYNMLVNHPTADVSLNDLSGIVTGGDTALAKLVADVNAKSPGALPPAGAAPAAP